MKLTYKFFFSKFYLRLGVKRPYFITDLSKIPLHDKFEDYRENFLIQKLYYNYSESLHKRSNIAFIIFTGMVVSIVLYAIIFIIFCKDTFAFYELFYFYQIAYYITCLDSVQDEKPPIFRVSSFVLGFFNF
jgi:hypothetical protein